MPYPDPSPRGTINNPRACVIGAGVTGAVTSLMLHRAGYDVVCTEARDICSGSSGRSAACIRAQWGTEGNVRAMDYSIRFYEGLATLLGTDTEYIRQNGYLYPIYDDANGNTYLAKRQQLYQMQRDAGLMEVEWLEPDDVLGRFSHLNPQGLLGATFCRRDGFIFPDFVAKDIFGYLKDQGGFELKLNTPVVSARVRGNIADSIGTAAGTIQADLYVNATNAWAPRVADLFHAPYGRTWSLKVEPRKRFLHFLLCKALTEAQMRSLPMTVFPSGAYIRPDGGAIMQGWEHEIPDRNEPEFTHEDQDKIDPGCGHDDEDSHGFKAAASIEPYLTPAVFDALQPYATTAGYYGITPDKHMMVDRDPYIANLFHITGCSGHGIMAAPFNAAVITGLIRQGPESTLDLELDDHKVYDLRPFTLRSERTCRKDPTSL